MIPISALPEKAMATILVVDDDPGIRTVLERVLRHAGYIILSAGAGQEAVHASNTYAGPIHLLITEIVLPDMSGPFLTNYVQLLRLEIPVLFLSLIDQTTLLTQGTITHEDRFLSKPLSVSDLLDTVREILR